MLASDNNEQNQYTTTENDIYSSIEIVHLYLFIYIIIIYFFTLNAHTFK